MNLKYHPTLYWIGLYGRLTIEKNSYYSHRVYVTRLCLDRNGEPIFSLRHLLYHLFRCIKFQYFYVSLYQRIVNLLING